MNKILIFFILSISLMAAKAQQIAPGNGIVKGVVLDATTKQPVEYANVVVYSSKDSSLVTGTVTDAAGKFVVKKVPTGNYYLVVQFIGYSKKYLPGISIDNKNHEKDLGIIALEISSNSLSEVEVAGFKNNVAYKIDKKVVDLSKTPADAGATAADALRNVSGVNVDLDGNITLRGSTNFIVLIDGKPSAMSGKDILKQIPAATIEKIELVTNPSAKYEAEGTAGIINVILKKGTQGFNGIVNAMAGRGDKYSGDFLFNIKRKRINFYVGSYMWNTRNKQYYYWNSEIINGADSNIVNFDLIKNDHNKGINISSGLDYNINSRNIISLSGEAGDKNTISRISYPQYKNITSESVNRYTMNNSYLENPWTYYYLNLNYQHKFDTTGHEFLFTSYFSNGGAIGKYGTEEQLSNYSGELFNYYYERSRVYKEDYDKEIQAKADYTLPLDTSQKFETGLFAKFRPKSSVLNSEYFDAANNSWLNNAGFSNSFDFYHTIYAAYFTYSKAWKKFEFQAGLRCEYADRLLDLKTTSQKYAYQKFDFFPSASLVRKIGKMGQLQLSYSRRINRPDEGSLNPFPDYSTSTILVVGNPDLKPEYINSYQLNYMFGPLAIETYYREVNDAIDGDAFASDGNGGLYLLPVNIDKKIYYGVDLSGGAPLGKWCLVQLKFSCYNYLMKGAVVSSSIPATATAYEAFLGARFIITKTTKLEGYGGFSSPSYNSQGKVNQYFYGGASLSQSFFKQMLTAKISINNPFNIFKMELTNSGPNSSSTVRMTRESNVVKVSLSYKINNYKAPQRNEDKPGNTNGGGKF